MSKKGIDSETIGTLAPSLNGTPARMKLENRDDAMNLVSIADVFSINTIEGIPEQPTTKAIKEIHMQTKAAISPLFQLKDGEVFINGVQQPRGYPKIDISGERREEAIWIR